MKDHPVLARLSEAGVKLGLERTRQLLAAIGEPHLAYPTVHVAGTNGKGSVCHYLTHTLVDAGYRVGTYLSPHLQRVNERVLIDGLPIDDGSLTEAIGQLDRLRTDWAQGQGVRDEVLTWFEFMTALAFLVFAERQVDVAVVEVGIGGRLDATNVISPVATAITSIGLDHQEVLGPTLAEIANEKAGILKPGVPCAVGPVSPEASEVIRRRAAAVGAEVWWSGTHLRRERRSTGWYLSTPDGSVGPVRTLPGAHQGANAAVALGVLHQLRRQGFRVSDEAVLSGIGRTRIAARIEEIRSGLIIDGAHNADGTTALAAWLAERPRPATRILLFGMGGARDPRSLLQPLLPHVDEVVLTSSPHPDAMDPVRIAGAMGDVDTLLSDGGPVAECLAEVFADADETVVAGSLYLAGAVRDLVDAGVLDGIEPGIARASEQDA